MASGRSRAWANLHGGFMLGLTVVAIASAAMIAKDRSRWRALLATFGFSALATLVNPLGIGLWRAVFQSIAKELWPSASASIVRRN